MLASGVRPAIEASERQSDVEGRKGNPGDRRAGRPDVDTQKWPFVRFSREQIFRSNATGPPEISAFCEIRAEVRDSHANA